MATRRSLKIGITTGVKKTDSGSGARVNMTETEIGKKTGLVMRNLGLSAEETVTTVMGVEMKIVTTRTLFLSYCSRSTSPSGSVSSDAVAAAAPSLDINSTKLTN